MVPPAQVGLLVEEDVGPVGHIQPCGEVDPGPEEAADEGGGDLVALIHRRRHQGGDQHGLCHLPPQPQVGQGGPQQAGQAPGGPDPREDCRPVKGGGSRRRLWRGVGKGGLLGGGLGWGLGLLGGVCGDGVRRRRLRRGGGEDLLHIGPAGDPLGHQPHRQVQPAGEDHPHQHHRPQGAGDPPGGPFQGQAEEHHDARRHRRRGGHGQQRLEKGFHGKTSFHRGEGGRNRGRSAAVAIVV